MRATARRRRRDGAAFDRPLGRARRHQSLDREIHLPRRLYSRPVGSAAADRAAPACWSPTSRSCGCTMPRRSRHWRERFLAHREEVERIYDQRFVRMWEFYLAASEMSFREQNMMVLQIQLTKRQGVVPMTRDYITREEQRLRALEGAPAAAAAPRRRIVGQSVRARDEPRSRQKPAISHRSVELVNCGISRAQRRASRDISACYRHNFRVTHHDIHGPRSIRQPASRSKNLPRSTAPPRTISRRSRRCWARSWSTTRRSTAFPISSSREHFFEPIHQKIYRTRARPDPRRQGRDAGHAQDLPRRQCRHRRADGQPVSRAARRRSDHHHQRRGLRPHRSTTCRSAAR